MSVTREHLHTRAVEFNGYKRSDGLWDIEAEMRDFRHYDTIVAEKDLLPAGSSVHRMAITVTIDDAFSVRAISARLKDAPFRVCSEVEGSLQAMVGATMGTGWRRALNHRLGGTKSCTHLRELLFNMATAAFQTIPTYQAQARRRAGLGTDSITQPPYYLGQCRSWRLDGPVVMRHFPQFHRRDENSDD